MMTGLRFRLSKKPGMLDDYQEYEIWEDESQAMLWVLKKRKGNAK